MRAFLLMRPRPMLAVGILALTVLGMSGPASGSTPGADTRLTNDNGANGGYVSNYTSTIRVHRRPRTPP